MGDLALEAVNLTAGYGSTPVIHDVRIRAVHGEITALVGPNGAGKSTMAKALAGVINAMSGKVLLGGQDVTDLSADQLAKKGLAYVPQVSNVFRSLTVRENLEMGGYSASRAAVRKKIAEVLDLFPDLRAALRRQARTLSGGQRSMLATARGLMLNPSVLILDEPTAGLSIQYEASVWEHILAVRERGVAILVVEQNTRRALANANKAYVLVQGRNQIEGTGAELLDNKEVADLYIGRAKSGGRRGTITGDQTAGPDEQEAALPNGAAQKRRPSGGR